ncbi:shikimate kinase [Photobacterium galatheae]|uniref:Adenylate kinase n=1 Tax=Photobacterium galatheae TaxID=1654360 RepID=A0A066RQC4_9GAMM|nr:shikimate kinase [Photobacterium galatheae]KDM89887.1 adenylate kinase [Photobacterium galatheae]MCM0151181.1 adenylate kinase [Photobacterium galatheae]
MQRINVIGTSGSGKSTFSQKLADALGYPYIEMDALFWQPNWAESTDEAFFATLEQALASPQWVLDGNYHRTVPIKWRQVDTIIWVDYSLTRTLFQAVKRAITRCLSQQELWPGTGNRETFQKTFLSRDSIVWWTMKTYSKNRARYLAVMADPNFAHIRFVQLRTPAQANQLIQQLKEKKTLVTEPRSNA